MSKVKKQSEKSAPKGHIRIIAGQHRGRKLPVLMADGLRPTTDRVKETVFNWLMPYIQDANCLDCFAGSGGLGFEAISRGASSAILVELNKSAAQQLNDNKALLKASNIRVIQQNALNFLHSNQQAYSLVFIDPPFRKGLAQKAAELLVEKGLTDEALIYVEMEADDNLQIMPSHWQLLKEKVAGQVIYRLYQNGSE
ncbi:MULTISPECIES: 16S rRNA (guanine(966)-N(2))-methyltransferase RsmD [unclassified Colwellia]|jgi:16S rRNA (guanine966-N2)-methyltransferase|uniref:16S rRNA (guanine(966)-N(2))-methyltransferase RsmD n=1 Tax=unclassified Colwellia TaxID=196834 RepID=UPI0015F39E43|nr:MULTISPECIES: 16S rRNA (guanine(966)-N(2))-methyltransferase RsmD [unclassified Colwellia]MBA6225595.1 16S rRNA (guanine(966)-N(2))-methyltransferase RsmD [Colwellia sp. MB3u-45]MBA6266737.1 16S rRNA (guanine(966)-N(2))-methyltransferase RsmD [Colwellia sp. MB3u-43]MBA6288201.1 16S rRNA (guanine(966)-N(2))-methyltransferase RsmD [Colwellia sp. MB3u-4]MBA6294635.1 16S rRNA (guanine(966)-N(2))-methyltransferase RsmD [Colwellia sp. MB02u-9]MBA6321755.1 16S rRNA (guanine(966)-N(2))-methyltransf